MPCSAPPARCHRDRCRNRPERPRQARARRRNAPIIQTHAGSCLRVIAPARPGVGRRLQTTRTTAIAWQSACESDKDELSQPWCCARSASVPLRRSRGSGPSRVTSISRQGNGMSGSANALITASLAANLAASLCTRLRPWQSLISLAVKTLRRYRSPNAASESWTSSMSTTSHPTRTRCPSTSPGKVISTP